MDLYAEPEDPRYPQVCFDESPVQLTSETRHPLPARPGQPACYDSEYKREGTANLFLFVQPLRGWRHVNVTHQRTKQDFAQQMRLLVDDYFPTAERIRLVVDNLPDPYLTGLRQHFSPTDASVGSPASSSFTTPRSMAVGSIWPSVSLRCWPASVWIAASRTSTPCGRRSPLGKAPATNADLDQFVAHVRTNSSASILPWNRPKIRPSQRRFLNLAKLLRHPNTVFKDIRVARVGWVERSETHQFGARPCVPCFTHLRAHW